MEYIDTFLQPHGYCCEFEEADAGSGSGADDAWWRGVRLSGLRRTTVEILELPVGKWTQSYKAELEVMILGDKEKEKEGVIKVCCGPFFGFLRLILCMTGLQGTPR